MQLEEIKKQLEFGTLNSDNQLARDNKKQANSRSVSA